MNTLFYRQSFIIATLLTFYGLFSCHKLAAQSVTKTGAGEMKAVLYRHTQPLRDLIAEQPSGFPELKKSIEKDVEFDPGQLRGAGRNNDDKPLYTNIDQIDGTDAAVLSVIEGIDEAEANTFSRPDVNGDAGAGYYIQMVNSTWFRVFNKNGTPASDMINTQIFWSPAFIPTGDPVICFDESTGRWLTGELSTSGTLLLAVSGSSDPLGDWFLYTVNYAYGFDYPKFGVWPESFIFTANNSVSNEDYLMFALNKKQMLKGALNVDIQHINIPGHTLVPMAVPMDWNGRMKPPGKEVYFTRLIDDSSGESEHLEIWSVLIDWTNVENTVATMTAIPVAPFNVYQCPFLSGNDCIPQPGTNVELYAFSGVPLYRVVYRNFGNYEAANLVFFIDDASFICGARWIELRRYPGADWIVYQEGTVAADDGNARMMGSIAMNARGDIGLGYMVSGDSTFLSARFTGRLAGDAAGQMTINENEFASGVAALPTSSVSDYTGMTFDPVDDSFWYTSQYMKGAGNYGTKIVNFKVRTDSFDIGPITLAAPQSGNNLSVAEPVTVTVKNFGLMPVSGFKLGYQVDNGAQIIENVGIASLNPGEEYTHTFAVTADLSTPGEHQVRVFSSLGQEWNTTNDTLDITRENVPHLDAGIIRVARSTALICSSTAEIDADIFNFGVDTIYDLTLLYHFNNSPEDTFLWNGVLLPGGTATVPLQFENALPGVNTAFVRTINPNGQQDERTENDKNAKSFQNIGEYGVVTLELTTDAYPEETTWKLTNGLGEVIYEGGPYTGLPDSTINIMWCLHPGECYEFSIFDSGENGLSSPRKYIIYRPDGSILAKIKPQGFLALAYDNFCFTTSCGLTASFSVTNASASNANDGAVLITAEGGTEPYMYSRNNGVTYQSGPVFNGLMPAGYPFAIKDALGCVLKKMVVVQTTVGVGEPLNEVKISVVPNPSANGVFQITTSGAIHEPATFRVMDVLGRTLLQHTADSTGTTIISLENYPAGIYFLCWQQENMSITERLVIRGD